MGTLNKIKIRLLVTIATCCSFFSTQKTIAFVLPGKSILQKTAENQGNGFYTIEQELTFQTGQEPLVIHETWVSDGERGLKVTAVGTGELKDKFKFQAVYIGGQRWVLNQGLKENSKIPQELTERPFHFRTLEGFSRYLTDLGVLPETFFTSKAYTKEKENFIYPQEPYLRLGRTQGVINYVFGAKPEEDQTLSHPGLWIEQDAFVIRKVRFPSQTELSVEEVGSFARGFIYPKLRTLRYGGQSVSIKTLSVQSKANMPQAFQLGTLEGPVENIQNQVAKEIINTFYKKLR